jgi:hypothetical protein
MKKLLVAVLGALALALPAFAAEEVSAVSLTAFTNAVPASTTHTNASTTDVVDIQAWKGLAMEVTGKSTTAGTENVTVTLARSLSTARGTTPGFLSSAATVETIRPVSFVFALNGTTTVRAITNFPASVFDGVSGVKVYSVGTGTNALSELTIKFLRKRTD